MSMIREANVGVGVYGKEGTSAVRSADFAIRRFRHLTQSYVCAWSLLCCSKCWFEFFFFF